ncbi:TVP38/TMEM64 family protein [Caloramator sp. E03]|uniref:TVP38/TMEM64 family protein n=1 Tax=Caloramator sp. E03 TaxID=2576307 RepID=UPI00111095A3|nr:TVP38/TMEM64 family protein [Caloramator sp. E03]QCX32426.1 TVP38/TMEM64 family protein [Caloramator sp. E03]
MQDQSMVDGKKSIKKLITLSIFLLLIIALVVYLRLYDIKNVEKIVESYGKFAPFIFLILCIIRPIILLPIGLFSVLGGILFGTVKGTAYTVAGSTIGSIIAYYMARYWGREWVEGLLKGKLKKLDNKCKEKGFTITFLMRVIPILPCDVVSYICGLSDIGIFKYIAGTILGIIPGTFIYSNFGSSLHNIYSWQFVFSIIFLILLSVIPIVIKKFYNKDLTEEVGIEFENKKQQEKDM